MCPRFERVAIVNRGEPAMRFIRAVRSYNREHRTEIRTLLLYTTPDARARFVCEADEALSLGAATFLDPLDGQRKAAYLDYPRLEKALVSSRADAVWVGWGFASERPEFAELCARLGLVFIGPDSESMRRLGDKIAAKQLAQHIGVPAIPWGGSSADSVDVAREQARCLGYPVMIKGTAGEGGRGIRKAESEEELAGAFVGAQAESQRLFGNPTVYVEKWVEGARHIEVQVLADQHGTTWAPGLRDCSIQRRHQKIVEEAPAAAIPADVANELREAAVRLCQAARYRNVGTVEFLYDPATRGFGLMEVNARLQVEHGITELTTGLDLVRLQIHIAMGGRLEGVAPAPRGHAIEVRLNAEDADNAFAPAPGRVDLFRVPCGSGLRLDSGVAEGDEIPGEFDSMFAKLICCAPTRSEALSGLITALEDSLIVISGGVTNRAFLMQLLERNEVRQNLLDVGWLDRQSAVGEHISTCNADVALLQAAIDVYEAEFEVEREQFFVSAARMRPVIRTEAGRSVELTYRGHRYEFHVYVHCSHHYRIDVGGSRIDVEISRGGTFERWLSYAGRRYHIVSMTQGLTHLIEVDGALHKISRDESGLILSYAPSVVVSVDVKPGDRVSSGARLALLEAMKMEMPIQAPFAGVVREVLVLNNSQVGMGAPLLRLDRIDSAELQAALPRIVFRSAGATTPAAGDAASRIREVSTDLRHLMLGSDIHPADAKRLVEEYSHLCAKLPASHEELNRIEDEILDIFVDVSSLFRRQATPQDPDDAERLSSGEYLLTYLRTMDSRGAGLPPSFIGKLQRALGHYGSGDLQPSPALKGRLLWIYKSHHQMEQQVPAIMAVLERRLANAEGLLGGSSREFLTGLDRLLIVSEGRFPALSDLVRDVRYRYFELPVFERARQAVYEQMDRHLAYLAGHPRAGDRDEHMRELVECPYPLTNLFSSRFGDASADVRRLMLEVLTRRYYRIRDLEHFHTVEVDGCCFAVADYKHEGRQLHLLTTHAEQADLGRAAAALRPLIEAFPRDHEIVIDLYVWRADAFSDAETVAAELQEIIDHAPFGRPIHRIAVGLAGPGDACGSVHTQHFTFRPCEDGYREERLYRGLHPMMSKRLQLWRLRNFNIERLESAEDVYLFRGVARDNPKDERLFAIAEVRDLTPVRDVEGRITQLPHLEHMFVEALASIRQVQLKRATEDRLYWNRVFLHVWPAVDLQDDELQAIAHRLARQTEGLGLEKVVLLTRMADPYSDELLDTVLSISNPAGRGIVLHFATPTDRPVRPLTEYVQKVVRMRQRGLLYPYEIVRMLTPPRDETQAELPHGEFVEHDLDGERRLVPADRAYGQNKANVVVGVVSNITHEYPEGMKRVILLGDPSRELGSIAEPECRRILAALDLAESMRVPVEWFTLSAGAKISMESGTENMDWISKVLRRLIEFTQAGGEVNVIVAGINVGAQPYWNAEATMLMHTRGILIMMPESAMVLTGKTALDYSGSVSAEDNQGIGGYEHVMGPNGQAQYWARDIAEACQILMRHYQHCYVFPGERFPRRTGTTDPFDRDVRLFPHSPDESGEFARVGDVFSDETNPGRKKPFDIRKVMLSVTDQDHQPLERWPGMQDAEVAVIWDAHIGGYPVCLMGFESRPVARVGFVATDGPDQWTSGTLFPMASKKVARAINAASCNRPLVILANLSGFDGSPESMRRRQLEFGAEIGRAIVNFKGPVVFCVISRYHGGAFVVFSRTLNENMEVVALEGTYASVIGGAPAAAVVFAREVDNRTRKDRRVRTLEEEIASAADTQKRRLRAQLTELKKVVRSEKLGEVAEEFDQIHSVHRALEVGSLDRIIPAADLRPYLVGAIERGIAREMQRISLGSAEKFSTTN